MSELNPKEPDKVQHGLMEPQLPLNKLNKIIHETIETIKKTVENMKNPPLVQEESGIGSKTPELGIER